MRPLLHRGARALLQMAASHSFWSLSNLFSKKLADEMGCSWPDGASSFDKVYHLAKAWLPVVSDEDILRGLQHRVVAMTSPADSDMQALAVVDEVLEKRGEKWVDDARAAAHQAREEAAVFRVASRQEAETVRVGAKAKGRSKPPTARQQKVPDGHERAARRKEVAPSAPIVGAAAPAAWGRLTWSLSISSALRGVGRLMERPRPSVWCSLQCGGNISMCRAFLPALVLGLASWRVLTGGQRELPAGVVNSCCSGASSRWGGLRSLVRVMFRVTVQRAEFGTLELSP